MQAIEMRLGGYRITGEVAEDGSVSVKASRSDGALIEAEMVLERPASDAAAPSDLIERDPFLTSGITPGPGA